MPAENKNTPKAPKLMDVARPGRSTPSASGRPIIVTNRPLIKQDPMVLDPAEGREPASAISRIGRPIRIEPLDGTDDLKTVTTSKPQPRNGTSVEVKNAKLNLQPFAMAKADEAIPAPEEVPAPKDSEPMSEPAAAPAPSAPPVSKPEGVAPADDKPEAPADDKQLAASKALEDAKKKEEDAKAAREAEQEKIIESKKYYLPISNTRDGRDLHVALILLLVVVVLGLTWLDIALDAGIIKISGLHPLTHFFHK